MATLRFAYTTREARIDPLDDEPPPQSYDLCATHAARTRPPSGWSLRDVRPDASATSQHAPEAGRPTAAREDAEVAVPPLRGLPGLGGAETIARLTEALRAASTPSDVRRDGVDEAV